MLLLSIFKFRELCDCYINMFLSNYVVFSEIPGTIEIEYFSGKWDGNWSTQGKKYNTTPLPDTETF